MWKEAVLIFAGGGMGSLLRYGVQVALSHHQPSAGQFPWSTFAVNLAGSFLIGVFYSLSARLHLPAEARLLLTTGLCGGFTTFSTFSYDGLLLLKQGHAGTFILYVLLSVTLGIGLAFAGSWSTGYR